MKERTHGRANNRTKERTTRRRIKEEKEQEMKEKTDGHRFSTSICSTSTVGVHAVQAQYGYSR